MTTKNNHPVTVTLPILLALLLVVPWALAKSTVDITLITQTYVAGRVLEAGPCEVIWITHSPEADVTFMERGKVVAHARGKMVERKTKAEFDEVITSKDGSGNSVLKEIRFAGKKSVLTFE